LILSYFKFLKFAGNVIYLVPDLYHVFAYQTEVMVLCEGTPGASCPERRNDSSVTLSKGDLMLCLSCEEHRFSELYRNKAVSAAASAVDVKTKTQPFTNPNSGSEKEVVHSDCNLV